MDATVHEEVQRREAYLLAVVEVQRRLLTATGDHLGALDPVLEPLGEAARASRVYLFENSTAPDSRMLMNQRAEWCAPGVAPELHNPALQGLPYDDFLPRWASEMLAGRPIQGNVADFPESERELLEPQGILSIVVIPFFVGGAFTGFVGFDNCAEARPWTSLEVSLLQAAATNIGLLLDQRRSRRELERANGELAFARDRAVEASRAKGTFLAKISHELRTPLNAIIGYTEILLDTADDPDPAELPADLRRVLGASRHLLTVINDLLDLSRAEAGKIMLTPRLLSVEGFTDELGHVSRQLARRNDNRFRLERRGPMGVAFADETRLRQVLLNLLSNAFKYTSAGEVTLRIVGRDDAVEIEVSDTGIGIPPDQLERIFDAFAQVEDAPTRNFEGTGLGLTITRHLCELMGLNLHVSSTTGVGSVFRVTVPRRLDGSA